MTYRHKIYHRSILFKIAYIFNVPLFLFFDVAAIMMYLDGSLSLFEAIITCLFLTILFIYFLSGLVYTVKITDKEIIIIRLFKRKEVINQFSIEKEIEIIKNRNSKVTGFDLIISDKSNNKYHIRFVTRKLLDILRLKGFIIPNSEIVKKRYFI